MFSGVELSFRRVMHRVLFLFKDWNTQFDASPPWLVSVDGCYLYLPPGNFVNVFGLTVSHHCSSKITPLRQVKKASGQGFSVSEGKYRSLCFIPGRKRMFLAW